MYPADLTHLVRLLDRLNLLPRSLPVTPLRPIRAAASAAAASEHAGCDHRRGCRVVAAARMVC